MWNFVFWLRNMKILDKKIIFSVKNKQKGKYVKSCFLISKRITQFLNKATYNCFLHDKGTKNLYTWVLKEHKKNLTLVTLVAETANPNICRFQWLENIS